MKSSLPWDEMHNINTWNLEYAPSITPDGRELFFTRANGMTHRTRIMHSTRASIFEPFGRPQEIASIPEAFVEGPTLTPDGKVLLYHRRVEGTSEMSKLFGVARP